jgi:hypothetical protein
VQRCFYPAPAVFQAFTPGAINNPRRKDRTSEKMMGHVSPHRIVALYHAHERGQSLPRILPNVA